MSDRIAVMNHGSVEQLGTPEELYERPATRFVADFIGTTNLVTGDVESIDAGMAVVRLSSGDACRVQAADLTVGRNIELSIRPESVELRATNDGGGSSLAPIAATVEQVAYLGGNVQYIVRTARGLSITALVPKASERLAVGAAVDVSWPSGEALVLDIADEQREEVRA